MVESSHARSLPIVDLAVDPVSARIYEHGWQSWSPAITYDFGGAPHRAATPDTHVMNYRPGRTPDVGTFQGEGLLAVQPSPADPVHVFTAPSPSGDIPSITARPNRDRVAVSADGPVDYVVDRGPGGIDGALARWAERFAAAAGVGQIRPAPTGWSSWYHYFTEVTEADIDENLASMDRLDLPIDVVQLDDGYQAEIGDWLTLSDRFRSLKALVGRIQGQGRRAGIWVAPFLQGARSETARRHPDWIVGGPEHPADAGQNWGQRVYAMDTTHPGACRYLGNVFGALREIGFDYFKIDFIYAAAIDGPRHRPSTSVEAYRSGLEAIRAAIGDAYLLGSGAPILPSVGLVDAMRVSPDTGREWEPEAGDMSKPSGRASVASGEGRAFQHGRFWVNDPDCLIVHPAVEHRDTLAAHVERFGGLRVSSDRLADLDEWGLATTRRLLAHSPAAPFVAS